MSDIAIKLSPFSYIKNRNDCWFWNGVFSIEKQKFALDGHLEMIEFVWDFTPFGIGGSWDCWRVGKGVNFV